MNNLTSHTRSDVIVYQTNYYHLFRMISGNRELDFRKIERIIKDINTGNDMLKYYPIQVRMIGETMEILDGQHRFFISTKLKRPVYYIVVEESKRISDIARINSNVEKWKYQNFINCYISENNESYIILRDFVNKYGFSIGISIGLLLRGRVDAGGMSELEKTEFQEGRFKVKQLETAIKIADNVNLFNKFKHYKDRSFISAIFKVMEAKKISIQELQHQFLKFPDMLTKNNTVKEYLFNLEKIANIKKHNRVVIM